MVKLKAFESERHRHDAFQQLIVAPTPHMAARSGTSQSIVLTQPNDEVALKLHRFDVARALVSSGIPFAVLGESDGELRRLLTRL